MTDLFTQPASLSDYICDLFVARMSGREIEQRRAAGVYRNIRPQDYRGYLQARGK